MKNILKNKWVKRLIWIAVILVLVNLIFGGNKAPVTLARTIPITKEDIEVMISGNGAITASSQKNVISMVGSTVKEIYFEEGDTVKAGDVIAILDNKDILLDIARQENNIKQTELNLADSKKKLEKLIVRATQSGYVYNLNAKENDFITTSTTLYEVVDDANYELVLQYIYNAQNPIRVGDRVSILLVDTMKYLDGEVSFVSDRRVDSPYGGQMIEVTIAVPNPGYTLEDVKAKATISTATATISSVNQDAFSLGKTTAIKPETSGKIVKVNIKEGQYVNAGDVIVELENEDLALSISNTEISLKTLYSQLTYSRQKLEDYKVIAPIDGVITAQSMKVGDYITNMQQVTSIVDNSKLEFKIAVDELDITKIHLDSEVKVTIDALEDTLVNPIVGKIEKIPLQGVTTGSVTDYYVTISIPGREDIKISMNADADITIERKENVLCAPIDAIEKENGKVFVEVKNGETYERREITTGISNSSYIEIVDGLREGDEVVLPELGTGMNMGLMGM